MAPRPESLTGLALCAGVGGLELGLRLALGDAYRTICYVERDAFCASTLVARMEDASLHPAPLWDDLATFDGRPWRGVVDLVSGGYPCQPFSAAGQRRGEDDPRHLWPHVRRVLESVRAPVAFFENVANHLNLGFEQVAVDLQDMGYRVAAGLFTAEEVGAPHKRERLFILAHAPLELHDGRRDAGPGRRSEDSDRRGELADTERGGCERSRAAGDVAGAVGASPGEAPERQWSRDTTDDRFDRGGSAMGNADDPRPQGRRLRGGECADERAAWPPSSAVADAECGGRDGRAPERLRCPEQRASPERPECGRHGVFPPGPGAVDEWRRIITARPDLAPAVESPVRGMADGLAGGLDRSRYRAERLSAVGNGVVPLTAALAFVTLYRSLMDTP